MEISGYRVVRRLGAGGMGEVFLVEHPRLPRRDALKLLSTSLSADAAFVARFGREAETLAGLQHPNIVTIFDRGEYEGRLWLAMEYIDGADLAHLLRERGRLTPAAVADVIDGVGAALDAAWRTRGLLHRDVKPANVLIAFGDEDAPGRPTVVKLVDFGIAKAMDEASSLTMTGVTVGTLAYMAPEAIESREVDLRTDLYSLACTAFELLTGSPPFTGDGMRAQMLAHIGGAIPDPADRRPGLPRALGPVFQRALAKEPADRFATGAEFGRAFRAALRTDEVSATVVNAPVVPQARTAPLPQPVQQPAHHPTRVQPAMPAPAWAGAPGPQAAQRSGGVSVGAWIAIAAVTMLAVVGVIAYLVVDSGSRSVDQAGATPAAGETTAITSEDSSAPAAPTVSGTDQQGFIGEYARCTDSEQLLAAMITEPAKGSGLPAHVVICSDTSGPVYRAMQVGDTVGISLPATRTADGYSAFNPNAHGAGGTGYAANLNSGVTVTSPDGSSEFLAWSQIWQR